jgi:hypothetical protein
MARSYYNWKRFIDFNWRTIISAKIKNVTPSNIYGKITMFILCITVSVFILDIEFLKNIFIFLSILFIAISLISYFLIFIKINR